MTDQDEQAPDRTVRRADAAVLRLTIGATAAALALSFRNQVDFASQRGGYAWWGAILWAMIIDIPVIVGELRLYSAAARQPAESIRIKAWAWTLTICGLIVSMSAGAAHVTVPAWMPVKVLAAVIPPLMAAASLGTGLGIVKLRNRPPNGGQTTQEAGQAADATPPRETSRARQPGKPPADLLALVLADKAEGLPVGRAAIQARHSVSEHHARLAAKAASNGAAPTS